MPETAIQRYRRVFRETFDVADEALAGLEYRSVPAWDSVGHLILTSGLEEALGITLEFDDVIALSSYEKGIEILAKYLPELASEPDDAVRS
ncbi:MAG: hypothetical protein KFB96_06560 [Thiocapsa sp.]|uniref:hypothetical protein n=1 Tax=Thiocapsa sp. TaxID=2024551 RepID=UPI001BCD8117|nr:hypothetical protein [Thiocapsa sp.]QVL50121.1 MAG: hypothetical protein KFB96_06560 [Thiocapsa sp.]